MAVRGQRPIPTALRLIRGGKPASPAEPQPGGRCTPPKPLQGDAARLWKRYIGPAHWLTGADSMKAYAFVVLSAEFLADPAAMVAARIGQMRCLGSELGLDPTSRARIGADARPAATDDTDKYFT